MILVVCANPSVDKWVFVDDFQAGRVNRVQRMEAFPGGKGVHVALALAELGEEVTLLGFWAGAAGQWVRDEVVRRGVQRVVGPETPGWTRTCLTFRHGEATETELLEPGPEVDARAVAELESLYSHGLRGAAAAVLSGSLPQGAPTDLYARLIESARGPGVPVVLDSSGPALASGLEAGPAWAKGNREEVSAALGLDGPAEALAEALRGYADAATVTLGAEGAVFARGTERLRVRGRVERLVSSVGSGDCMTAGIALGLARGLPLRDLARFATACAMANCVHGELGMLRRQDVAVMADRVEIVENPEAP